MAKIRASTQSFTEIKQIQEDIAIFSGGNACLVIELSATNFALLSQEEQDAKISSYAALLNSLSFPIQIIVRSKKLDVSSYLKLLEQEAEKTENTKLSDQILKYKDFVAELVKVNTVLDKKFYMVLPYSHLENPRVSDFTSGAKSALHTKEASVYSQLSRLNLKAKTLQEEELIKLFKETYNNI